ncbi:Sigma factor regulator N-terminal [Salinibacillus kushneri]|uniref:Sigma factor regulator N-terminal n=1 Tax=Salinibacillus kushneri TaxID=237682 RepID=A0A1I0AKF6_9BACI|nr:anti-sigma factor [Salinibacillus kushneri]SES94795.1 Sigma factor regulator N-terminal [Salinibacillus kushneri]
MEVYQSYLDEELGEKKEKTLSNSQNYQKILRKGKWKARITNAGTAIGILILIAFISSIINVILYSWGDPDRIEVYNDVIKSTLAVTQPNIDARSGGSSVGYFFLNNKRDLKKRIGNEYEKVGSFEMNFLYGIPLFEPIVEKDINQNPMFYYPVKDVALEDKQEWSRLEHLPEGTVVEAFVSLDQPYSTEDLLSLLENYQTIEPVWFAVETGIEKEEAEQKGPGATEAIGFPSQPIWHPEDLNVMSRKTEDTGFFSRVTSESGSLPPVEEYGSAELRNENFMHTLELMADHKGMVKQVARLNDLRLDERIHYLNNEGVHIYGIVITGPTKEILELKGENWITNLTIGEVRLWN